MITALVLEGEDGLELAPAISTAAVPRAGERIRVRFDAFNTPPVKARTFDAIAVRWQYEELPPTRPRWFAIVTCREVPGG